jgi:hypothetical protein
VILIPWVVAIVINQYQTQAQVHFVIIIPRLEVKNERGGGVAINKAHNILPAMYKCIAHFLLEPIQYFNLL